MCVHREETAMFDVVACRLRRRAICRVGLGCRWGVRRRTLLDGDATLIFGRRKHVPNDAPRYIPLTRNEQLLSVRREDGGLTV